MAKNAAVETENKAVVEVADLESEAKALTKDNKKTKVLTTKKVLKTKVDEAKDRADVLAREMKMKVCETMDAAMVTLHDPQFQTCTITTAGGAIVFGGAGGAFGLASGIVVGSAAGVLPALFTFGLSVPAGGAIGATGGLCAGTLLGGAAGGIGGFTTYKYRIEIKDGMMTLKVRAQDTLTGTKNQVVRVSSSAKAKVEAQVLMLQASVSDVARSTKKNSVAAVDLAKAKASKALNFATTTKVGVTSSGAVAGAVVGGTSTGAFGTVAGAALGIVPAIFTFGLSIPAGAMVGLCVGTAVGGSAGAMGGGLIGYGGYTHGAAISEGVQSSCSKVSTKAEQLKTKSFTCAAKAKQSVKSMIKPSTGGSSELSEIE